MKKLIFILTVFTLTSCSKSKVNPSYNTTIQYTYTSTTPATYVIYYTDSNGNNIKTNFSGTTWSKTIYTDSTKWVNKNNGIVQFDMQNTQSVSPEITGTINIFLNQKLAATEDIKVQEANGSYSIVAVILKQP